MSASAEGNESDPNLTPLLDVVLQLIMFFMITVNFVRVEPLSEQVRLPVSQSAVVLDDAGENWVYLNIDRNGKLIVPGEDMEDAAKDKPGTKLEAYLQKRKQELQGLARQRGQPEDKPIDITVIVSADGDVSALRVSEILDVADKVGLKKAKLRAFTRSLES